LRHYSVKSILIRPEYIVALAFAIFVAQGGMPGRFAKTEAEEEDDNLHPTSQKNEWDSTMKPNPFSSLDAGVTSMPSYIGHPGTGT
jgi:hypothetical protein